MLNNKELCRNYLSEEAALAIKHHFFDEHNSKAVVSYGNSMLTNIDNFEGWGDRKTTYSNLKDLDIRGVRKISVEAIDYDIFDKFDFDSLGCHYYGNHGEPWYMVMNKNATKLNGIKAIADAMGISLDEVAAFGDDYNDIDMLTHCGISVAMGNAPDKVKATAKHTCGTNDDDGLANWLIDNLTI